jgi:GTP-binding protein
MPGIIKGAHEGKGLGLWFLRHIERTRMLVFVLDAAAGHPKRDYDELLAEVGKYKREILGRTRVVVMNKIDLLKSRGTRADFGQPVVWVSGLTGEGIGELRAAIEQTFARA